jgi:hypothetical protein
MKKLKILSLATAIVALSAICLYAQRGGHGGGGGGFHGGGGGFHGGGEMRGFNRGGYGARPYYGVGAIPIGYAGYYGNNCGYMGYWNQWRCW